MSILYLSCLVSIWFQIILSYCNTHNCLQASSSSNNAVRTLETTSEKFPLSIFWCSWFDAMNDAIRYLECQFTLRTTAMQYDDGGITWCRWCMCVCICAYVAAHVANTPPATWCLKNANHTFVYTHTHTHRPLATTFAYSPAFNANERWLSYWKTLKSVYW